MKLSHRTAQWSSPAVGPIGAVLVVSGDAQIRGDWSAQLESHGYRVVRCVGPQIQCALSWQRSCPLRTDVRWAVYDADSVTRSWLIASEERPSETAIVVARDRVRSDGHHEPVVRRSNGAYVPLRWELAKRHSR